jgi:thiamine kinase-like enzyme
MEKLVDIISKFDFSGDYIDATIIQNGHINDTYKLTFSCSNGQVRNYILQKINTNIFKDPLALMQNINVVSTFLQSKLKIKERTLQIVKTKNDELFLRLSTDDCWRAFDYIEKTISYQKVTTSDQMYKAGKAIANFHSLLSEFPTEELHTTIENFHNTGFIYEQFVNDFQLDKNGKSIEVSIESSFFDERKKYFGLYQSLKDKGQLPIRVCHNDTKFNNILFDNNSKEPIAIIDLDTVMPGFILNDFGDAVRTGANSALEDESNLDKIQFNILFFESFSKGYLEIAQDFISKNELTWLAYSPYIITLEQGIRFLHDHINGDVYFKTSRNNHNLDRARNQIKLAMEMEGCLDNMKDIVNNQIKSNSTF